MIQFVDTHCHLDGEEFAEDRDLVVERAKAAGVSKIFIPAIDLKSCQTVMDTCQQYPDFCYPMLGLHPEEVRSDWRDQLKEIRQVFPAPIRGGAGGRVSPIAIGEVGLDFYWSREFEQEQIQAFEQEQIQAFEEQVRWSVETCLPLMIHCRKAQNEMVSILKRYANDLPGGVFHCFTGNEIEARELLQFENFVLGIGGVFTFKKSHLPEVLPAVVPLDRIVLETDAPYMAPVPHRGKRNESAFVLEVLRRLAEAYGVSEEEVARQTNENVARVFGIK